MKITGINPTVITSKYDDAINLFESLGFEIRHHNRTNVRMKDANGFHVDVTEGESEWTMIRMNVDNLEEAVEFFESRGFHKANHAAAHDTIDTGSSKINIMVSPSGTIFSVSEHIKED